SRLDDEVAGLGHDAKPETTHQFAAKAHSPNHQKTTGALAYNAERTGDLDAAKRRQGHPCDAFC
ncbi:hypothetical protein, partial [Marinobacter alexandrii]|uniref:hypothetical protein n=1 Tax=Marinobacter alexandrii TaxID=2570351 RepID=UPI001BB2AC27